VRGKEVAYVPFSKADFDRLPWWRRTAERFFRSPIGCGSFYFLTVYLPHEMFVSRQRGAKGNAWRTFQHDRIQVSIFAGALVLATILIARAENRPPVLSLVFTTIVPGIGYFWLMSFVTFMHHTHQRAPWYSGEEDFEYFG